VVVDGHDKFVDGRLVLLARREVREVAQVDGGAADHGAGVTDGRLQRDPRVGEPVAGGDGGRAERAARGQRGSGLVRPGERPGLGHGAELLREPLDPAAGHGVVVVDVDVGAPADRGVLPARVEQHEELVVLAAQRVEVFVAGAVELPVDEHGEAVPVPDRSYSPRAIRYRPIGGANTSGQLINGPR
jgi:hypothetical protein